MFFLTPSCLLLHGFAWFCIVLLCCCVLFRWFLYCFRIVFAWFTFASFVFALFFVWFWCDFDFFFDVDLILIWFCFMLRFVFVIRDLDVNGSDLFWFDFGRFQKDDFDFGCDNFWLYKNQNHNFEVIDSIWKRWFLFSLLDDIGT